jgi:hypothetical protein
MSSGPPPDKQKSIHAHYGAEQEQRLRTAVSHIYQGHGLHLTKTRSGHNATRACVPHYV